MKPGKYKAFSEIDIEIGWVGFAGFELIYVG